jgi:hypothetical protein
LKLSSGRFLSVPFGPSHYANLNFVQVGPVGGGGPCPYMRAQELRTTDLGDLVRIIVCLFSFCRSVEGPSVLGQWIRL